MITAKGNFWLGDSPAPADFIPVPLEDPPELPPLVPVLPVVWAKIYQRNNQPSEDYSSYPRSGTTNTKTSLVAFPDCLWQNEITKVVMSLQLFLHIVYSPWASCERESLVEGSAVIIQLKQGERSFTTLSVHRQERFVSPHVFRKVARSLVPHICEINQNKTNRKILSDWSASTLALQTNAGL